MSSKLETTELLGTVSDCEGALSRQGAVTQILHVVNLVLHINENQLAFLFGISTLQTEKMQPDHSHMQRRCFFTPTVSRICPVQRNSIIRTMVKDLILVRLM